MGVRDRRMMGTDRELSMGRATSDAQFTGPDRTVRRRLEMILPGLTETPLAQSLVVRQKPAFLRNL